MVNIELRESKNPEENEKAVKMLVGLDDITITILPAGQVAGFDSVSIKNEEGFRYYGLRGVERFVILMRRVRKMDELRTRRNRQYRLFSPSERAWLLPRNRL